MFISGLYGQITESDGLRMPGSWDWSNSNGMGGDFDLTKESTGTLRWHTVFQYTGSSGNQDFKFVSGDGNPWYNQWANNSSANVDQIENFNFYIESDGASNNSIYLTQSYYYTVNWQDQGYVSSNAIFMETSAAPVTLDALSYLPSGTIEPWDEVEVTITTSAAPCAEENVFVRYTTDGYSNSNLLEVSFVGSTGTATIPAFPANTNVSFYAYSTTLVSGDIGTNHDMVTINYINNGGSNYSYTVNDPATYTSTQPGNFSTAATWGGSVPAAEKALAINHAVVMDVDYNASEVTINSGGELSFSGAETVTIRGNGSWTNDGSFTAGNGTIVFQDFVSVGGTNNSVFNNVTVSGLNVDFDNPVTDIAGVLKITTGSILNAPELLSGSTLQYEQGGSYTRVTEWNNPYNVVVANNTALDLNIDALGNDITVLGNLTISSGSAVSMGAVAGGYDLIVNGDLDISGTLALSGNFASDLQLKGNWYRTGTFTSNSRSVSLNGTSDQSINGVTTFDYLIVDKSGGKVTINNDIEISGILTLTSGLIDNNGNTLTVSDEASTAIAGASSSSYIAGTLVRGIKQIAKRGVSSKGDVYLFPIGTATSYNPATVDFTTLPSSAGTITASFSTSLDPNYESGLPMTDGVQEIDHLADGGYWQLTPSGLADYTYDLTIQGSDFVDDPAYEIRNADGLRLLIRDDFSSPWQFLGTHDIGTASPPGVTRTGISGNMGIIAMGGLFSENPLPVDLSFFRASAISKAVKLQWETLTEKDNDRFEIYRSANSIDFSKIATISGAGYSDEAIQYEYIDDLPAPGLNYYYLKQFDFDGECTMSDVVAADNQGVTNVELRLLDGQLLVEFGFSIEDPVYYQIIDIKGAIVKEGVIGAEDANKAIKLPIERILIVRLYTDRGFSYARKIITIGINKN